MCQLCFQHEYSWLHGSLEYLAKVTSVYFRIWPRVWQHTIEWQSTVMLTSFGNLSLSFSFCLSLWSAGFVLGLYSGTVSYFVQNIMAIFDVEPQMRRRNQTDFWFTGKQWTTMLARYFQNCVARSFYMTWCSCCASFILTLQKRLIVHRSSSQPQCICARHGFSLCWSHWKNFSSKVSADPCDCRQ